MGIIITTCIWFSLALRIFDAKLKETLPALAICFAPYFLTAMMDLYMAPYNTNGGGNVWISIFDSYGNIFFHSGYHMLAGWPGQSMIATTIASLLLQIFLPFAMAYILRFSDQKFRSRRYD
jgi:hypothetical protein